LADHHLPLERATLHGNFDATRTPALTIDPGDRVVTSSMDAGWHTAPGEHFPDRDPKTDGGHALTGPIAVRGARPGSTLMVQIEELRPGDWGWNAAGGFDSPWNRQLGMAEEEWLQLDWTVDVEAGHARDQFGHTVPLRPFLGVMGMPPAAPHAVPTAPPRATGGNIDCRELVAGSTLYLPVAVDGGLFSCGDGHATQADGELSGMAIECPMDRIALRFDVRDDLHLATPRAETPAGWLTFGFHEDLDQAAAIAVGAMLDLMGELTGLERRVALALSSLVVDLRVTQMVNGIKGCHALLPHEALPSLRGTDDKA
jgi:acetamidase/formamidase